MNPLKYGLATAMVKRSISHSTFDPVAAETNITVDRTVPQYNNSYYFTGHADDGTAVIMRLAGRGTGDFELWFSLYLPGRGRLSAPMSLQRSVASFADSPLRIACVEAERRWECSFAGTVYDDTGAAAEVRFASTLTSAFPIFHFTNDLGPAPLARAMAAERWTRDWFMTLRTMHQDHYEQGGDLAGTLAIDGGERRLAMKFFRDHSFGPRSWDAMDRHVWLALCLDNGAFVNLSLPQYPFIKLTAGFHAQNNRSTPVVSSTPFAAIAPERQPPRSFAFWVDLADGRRLEGACVKGPGFSWLMDDAYRVFEWVSEFTLGGVHGRGICEFGYNVRRFDYGTL